MRYSKCIWLAFDVIQYKPDVHVNFLFEKVTRSPKKNYFLRKTRTAGGGTFLATMPVAGSRINETLGSKAHSNNFQRPPAHSCGALLTSRYLFQHPLTPDDLIQCPLTSSDQFQCPLTSGYRSRTNDLCRLTIHRSQIKTRFPSSTTDHLRLSSFFAIAIPLPFLHFLNNFFSIYLYISYLISLFHFSFAFSTFASISFPIFSLNLLFSSFSSLLLPSLSFPLLFFFRLHSFPPISFTSSFSLFPVLLSLFLVYFSFPFRSFLLISPNPPFLFVFLFLLLPTFPLSPHTRFVSLLYSHPHPFHFIRFLFAFHIIITYFHTFFSALLFIQF
ncbi:unnamed protein product [Acanthosepion pharaonis]|uniref:Uncharacterized protein n=1 Tax=Acanthosepion pharaonis TaxID=158019 RepID=A0A812CAC8_ACAPH|nr:unnamed protein product [Sepia pharaonis]